MNKFEIDGLRLGEGLPKICVPLTGNGMPALLSEMQYAVDLPADFFEWRADCFFGDPLLALPYLKPELGGKPILCTVRTKREGGSADLAPEEYEALLSSLMEHGGFDLLDIELSCGRERTLCLLEKARRFGLGTVVSKHDFYQTPAKEVILRTLEEMKDLGADLPKYAVMPQTSRDVLTLLEATLEARERLGPVITMSMGSLGIISRVSGAFFGSCVTFAAGKNASAPGQIGAEDMNAILQDLAPREA